MVEEITNLKVKFDCGWNCAIDKILDYIDDFEVKDPYEQCVQYDSIKAGIQAHAETYSFNIESNLFNQLTKEQQKLWRKEIEQACVNGGEVGAELARDTRYYACFDSSSIILWLESIKERMKGECISVTDEELAQAKKDAYNDALDKIEYHSGEPTFDDGWSAAIWYLKKKNAQPQNTWKPSEEQMEALWNAIPHIPNSEKDIDTITELSVLYNDLKKLKEEWL